MKRLAHALLFTALLAASASGISAQNVGGIDFADEVPAARQALQLQGAGVRTRFGFRVYAMGLYLAQPQPEADAIIAAAGEKRIRIVLLRDLEAKQFADAMVDGLRKNHDAETLAALQPSIDRLLGALRAIGAAPKGTEIHLDQLADGGTRLSVNGSAHGDDIADSALYPALLRIWLGQNPADSGLKSAIIGARS